MQRLWNKLVRLAGSFGLACTLLILLGLLTWLGTLEQTHSGLYEVQHKYFESFVLLHDFGPFSLPLPGANLVICVLALNLVVGGVLRIRKNRSTAGILIAHLGILLLFAAAFVKWRFASEGQITLFEGQSADTFQDAYRCELSIVEHTPAGERLEILMPQEALLRSEGNTSARWVSSDLPFALEVQHFARNSRVLRKGPMFDVAVPVLDGFFLSEEPLSIEAETNIAGAYLRLSDSATGEAQQGIVWSAEGQPWSAKCAGRTFSFELRNERHPLPFEIALKDFSKVDHPGTSMPQSFTSDVTINEAGSERALRISMNEPLRSRGLVVYQASWGPQGAREGARLFSTFAVVRNPADRLPLYACIVIACGLLLHFGRKLRATLRARAVAT